MEGVEPSARNIALAHTLFPSITIHHQSFQAFSTSARYDLLFSIMALSHLADLDAAMATIASLLAPGGIFLTIVPDFAYMRTPRVGYTLDIEELSDDAYLVATTRPTGTIVDLIRTTSAYRSAAEHEGLSLVEERGLVPTAAVIARDERYAAFRTMPMKDLLRFELRSA